MVSIYYWRNFLVWIQVFVNIHGKIHHVSFAKQIQFCSKELIFLVDLK
jgi:hypothetical protein